MNKATKLQEFSEYLWNTVLSFGVDVLLRHDGIGSNIDAAKVLQRLMLQGPGQNAEQMGREDLPGFKVLLTYFNSHGKFKYEGTYRTFKSELYQIFDEVREMHSARKLPGLVQGHSEYIVYITVPTHPHNYPSLIIGGEHNE